jgi:hypothetical protein
MLLLLLLYVVGCGMLSKEAHYLNGRPVVGTRPSCQRKTSTS